MTQKKTLTYTFHYWGAFCPGGFCPRPLTLIIPEICPIKYA